MFHRAWRRGARHVLLLVGLLWAKQLAAQGSRATTFYWDTRADSLRQILATQHTDTARLRTLMHLVNLGTLTEARTHFLPETSEAAALSARLHRPELPAYRRLAASCRLVLAGNFVPARDSLQAAITDFDRLGRPIPWMLTNMWFFYNRLHRVSWDAYFLAKLAQYQRHGGPPENLAVCYQACGRHYQSIGDYSQAISYYLQSAELFRQFSPNAYRAVLADAGSTYAEWGNTDRGLHYLQQATQGPGSLGSRFYAFLRIGQINLQHRHYPEALHAIDQFLQSRSPTSIPSKTFQAYALLTQGAVRLAQGRPTVAGPLLQAAQHLADSLAMHLEDAAGLFELDAAWARYYAALGKTDRAETYWLAAYHKASQANLTPLRLSYLRELGAFYQRQHQPAAAAAYALAALNATDTVRASEGPLHIARFEIEQVNRAQTLRIAGLRQDQALAAAHARRQHLLLGAALVVLALIGGVALLLWRSNRLRQQSNRLLKQQKLELQTQRDQTAQALADLKTAQAQLIQQEKLASVGQLAKGIVDRLLNPLNYITNFLQASDEVIEEVTQTLAQQTALPPPVVDDLQDGLGFLKTNSVKIQEHSHATTRILQDMQKLLKEKSHDFVSTELNGFLEAHIQTALQELRPEYPSLDVHIRFELASCPVPVALLPVEFGQLLRGVVSNACYTLAEKSKLTKDFIPELRVSTQFRPGQAVVRLRDNGKGIVAREVAKLFSPFFTTKPTAKGTGLGLYMAKDIVEAHHGHIEIDTREGEFTEVVLTLPATSEC